MSASCARGDRRVNASARIRDRRAMERVWERERRWQRSRGELHHLRGAWPRARQP